MQRQIEKARGEVADKDELVLDKDTPLRSARSFVERIRPELMHYNDDWLSYDGAAYAEIEEATIRAELYEFLDGALQIAKKGPHPFRPTRTRVSDIEDALKAETHRPRDIYSPPCWLVGEGPPPREIVACRNGLLHLPTGELLNPTPRFFTRNTLDFDHDPNAPEPECWHAFLDELWPEDPGTISVLQELFGYLLIPDTSQQKIFLLTGPPRSGKGTIARVLTRLVGKANTVAPSLVSLQGDFGLQPLIGKQLALISDMRIGPKTDRAAIAENLLRISGEDMVSANRKYKRAWDGRLAVRFLIMTNELPAFKDASGALANRFVPLLMTETFLGRENHGLLDELLPELPGILAWAIEGWRRLQSRGHFVPSEASREAVQQLADLASPVAAFIRVECEFDPGAITPKAALFSAWQSWCHGRGEVSVGTLDLFGRDLIANCPGRVKATKERTPGSRIPAYRGIKLRDTGRVHDDLPF